MAERLDRERIVRRALDLLDEVGLDGLTLRRLAGDLGVQVAALYWHVPSKAALLDEMATTMLRDLIDAAGPEMRDLVGEPWQDCVRVSADRFRAALLGRRDGARVFSGTYVTDERLRGWVELPLSILVDAGFAEGDASRAWSTLLAFVVGFVVEEQGRPDRDDDADVRFAFGVDVVVRGLESRLAADAV
ncbi:TetR/AcrR family transcriptional regulator C-terminal domain-containing protein [Cellulomonas fimi]|uniref:TetR/AcrR family transcriptional regulator C-terminal domain-containing protein n=1 Tax=Cellulomonas fimi TaxID=1708 RepID=UPI00234C43C9|nr:TetR/AcrR family transcriptional regulator C-terminal domain-containing protein [Cellulomonas fimi]MDC7121178.1 TetR/AcrR family transcriptional regulator C-terminal domain-containing protein [Cellulomonas fimi]